jgi:hypothetical protein
LIVSRRPRAGPPSYAPGVIRGQAAAVRSDDRYDEEWHALRPEANID